MAIPGWLLNVVTTGIWNCFCMFYGTSQPHMWHWTRCRCFSYICFLAPHKLKLRVPAGLHCIRLYSVCREIYIFQQHWLKSAPLVNKGWLHQFHKVPKTYTCRWVVVWSLSDIAGKEIAAVVPSVKWNMKWFHSGYQPLLHVSWMSC